MTEFVADASIVAAWVLPDESNVVAEIALSRLASDDAVVPDLLWHEIRNVLLAAVRQQRISYEDLLTAIVRLRQAPIKTANGGDDLRVLELGRKHQLSAYDSAYLALAIEERIPLATLDRRLVMAAEAEGVELLASS